MVQDIVLGSDYAEDAFLIKLNPDITEIYASIAAIAAGSGVIVSTNDTIPGVLNGKLVVDEDLITLTENTDGGNETLTLGIQSALRKFAL